MKAALLARPFSFHIVDQLQPQLRPGWALVKVEAAGLCGSDLHFYKGELPIDPTVVRGHEIAGVIADPGDTGLTAGQAVVVNPLVGCGLCPNCRRGQYHICEDIKMIGRDHPGGFAEYVAAPAGKLYPFDSHKLSFVQAALADGVAVGVHAVNGMDLAAGQSAVIIGDGTIGLMILQVAVARGANPVIVLGKHDRNLGLARRMGATHAVNIQDEEPLAAVRRLAGKVDVVFEAAGGPEPMLETALHMLRKGGRVAVLGLIGATNVPIPWLDVVVDERSLIGLQGYSNYKGQDEMSETVRLMEVGLVTLPDDAITTLPLAEIDRGFRLMLERAKTGTIKVVALPKG